MLLGPLLRLEVLIFVVTLLVVVLSVSSLAGYLSFAENNLNKVFIEIDLSYLLQNVFELILAGHLESTAFEVETLPHIVQLAGVELDRRARSLVAGNGKVVQLLEVGLHELLVEFVQVPHCEVVLNLEDYLHELLVHLSVFQNEVLECVGRGEHLP